MSHPNQKEKAKRNIQETLTGKEILSLDPVELVRSVGGSFIRASDWPCMALFCFF